MLHIWHYLLSKNYLTRSPSWDEHISFSRVSWPTSRHQVNTLFQFQYANRDKLTYRGLLNGFGLNFILQEFDLLLELTLTVWFLHQWHITQATHNQVLQMFWWAHSKCQRQRQSKKQKLFSVTCHVDFVRGYYRIIHWISNTHVI